MYTISLTNPLAPKTSAASEIQVGWPSSGGSPLLNGKLINFSFYSDFVKSQPGERVLHRGR